MNGDQADIAGRLRKGLPRSWFGRGNSPTPVLDALLMGMAAAFVPIFDLIAFVRLQSRITTATGGWLDLAAYDYFGDRLPRFAGEGDRAYSVRIRREVFRRRNTRQAIIDVVRDLTGRVPDSVFEGWHPQHLSGYGTPRLAYGRVGTYGSTTAPFQTIVTMPLPQGYGIPNRPGWGSRRGGYGGTIFAFISESMLEGSGPTQTDILLALDNVRAAGTEIIVHFTDPLGFDPTDSYPEDPGSTGGPGGLLDFNKESGAGLIPFL